MKFAAGVTLYNPTDIQINNIKQYSRCFDIVYFFDNTETDYHYSIGELADNIVVLNQGDGNKGLPYAYNTILKECIGKYDFLCTLDQDSIYSDNEIASVKEYILTIKDNVGIVAPYIDYGFGKHKKNKIAEKKSWVITSGAFVNLHVVEKEGLRYDENYFIDKFEIDLCQQMIEKGYDVLMYHNSVLLQRLGEDSGHHYPNHSVLRHYYLFRNRFYFNKKWYRGLKWYCLSIMQTINHIILILLYEKDKFKKITVLKSAYIDYKRKNMGKLDDYGK